MSQRIFVNVVGFSDAERHALNTLFRLSGERQTAYAPWTRESPEPALLMLLDGSNREAQLELEWPGNAQLKLIWIGDDAPAKAWKSFPRPIAWPDVIQAMDELFAAPVEIDFDLDVAESSLDLDLDLDLSAMGSSDDSTAPGLPAARPRRALIAAASLEERLYLRARLALAGLTVADEATSEAQAIQMAQATRYDVALVDLGLGVDGWDVVRALKKVQPPVGQLVAIKWRPGLAERLKAKFVRVNLFSKPPDFGKLDGSLQK